MVSYLVSRMLQLLMSYIGSVVASKPRKPLCLDRHPIACHKVPARQYLYLEENMPVMEHPEKVRTTVRLPKPLYAEAQKFVDRRDTPLSTINDFFIAAIRAYVKLMDRKRIDAGFARMAEDTEYQKEARLIAEEFSQSDWEALETIDKEQEASLDR